MVRWGEHLNSRGSTDYRGPKNSRSNSGRIAVPLRCTNDCRLHKYLWAIHWCTQLTRDNWHCTTRSTCRSVPLHSLDGTAYSARVHCRVSWCGVSAVQQTSWRKSVCSRWNIYIYIYIYDNYFYTSIVLTENNRLIIIIIIIIIRHAGRWWRCSRYIRWTVRFYQLCHYSGIFTDWIWLILE